MVVGEAGLVEALMWLHQPKNSWSANLRPRNKVCAACSTQTWPCSTVKLIADATGSPVPDPVMTMERHPIDTPDTNDFWVPDEEWV